MNKLIDKNTPDHGFLMGVKLSSTTTRRVITYIDLQLKKDVQVFISTPNPEIVLCAQKNDKLREALNSSDVAIPDGIGLLWAAKQLNFPYKLVRIQGRELMEELFELANKKKRRVFLLGGDMDTNKIALNRLKKNFPELTAEGTSEIKVDNDGNSDSNQNVIKLVNEFEPDLLFVAFGAPKQEKWIYKNRAKLKAKVIMTVGGALDYYSGKAVYPPALISRLGMEWLWRLLTQPSRFPRIFNAVIVFPLVVLSKKYDR